MEILYLFSLFLLLPKIDLFEFGGSSVRPEDIVWLIAIFSFVLFRIKNISFKLPDYFHIFIVYILLCVFSLVINSRDSGWGGVYFILRQIQYATWGMMAIVVSNKIPRDEFRKHLEVLAIIFVIWGGLEWLGLVGKVGKFSTVRDRISINTSGPFETSVVLAVLAFSVRGTFLKISLGLMLWFTQARITIIASIMAILYRSSRSLLGIGIATLILLASIFLAGGQISSSRFSDSLSPLRMVHIMNVMWQSAPVVRSRGEFLDAAGYTSKYIDRYNGQLAVVRGDLSFQIRAYRWALIGKFLLNNPLQMIIGCSPGYFGVAVDSNLIRLIAESGILGSITYLFFIFSFWNFPRDTLTRQISIVMLITAIFIDIFWSSKVMTMLWFISSWEYNQKESLLNSQRTTFSVFKK